MIHFDSFATRAYITAPQKEISSSSAVVLPILKTANRERILPLRIEGKMICELGQVAATQQDHEAEWKQLKQPLTFYTDTSFT